MCIQYLYEYIKGCLNLSVNYSVFCILTVLFIMHTPPCTDNYHHKLDDFVIDWIAFQTKACIVHLPVSEFELSFLCIVSSLTALVAIIAP